MAEDAVWIVTGLGQDVPVTPTGRIERGAASAVASSVLRAVEVGALKENMERFLGQLREILGAGVERVGAFELSEVELTAQISADGKVGLVGSGIGVEAQGGIRLTLRRRTG